MKYAGRLVFYGRRNPKPMSKKYKSWFRCFDGCGERYGLGEIIYRCRRCESLLEVCHDFDALAETSPGEWKSKFSSRRQVVSGPLAGGVWAKKEWVCPEVEDKNIVSLGEGYTPLLKLDGFFKTPELNNVYVKLCGSSHTGSFKDLGLTVLVSMVRQMRSHGVEIPAVACASTGDTSAALAAYCARAGLPCIVFLPEGKITPSQLIQPVSNGAITLAIDTDFDGCMELVQQVTSEENIDLANSMNSLRIEGQKTVAIEIAEQLNWQVPDWVVIPGGNLGNVSALGLGFRMMHRLGLIDRLPRICCAQSKRANPLYRSYISSFNKFEPIEAEKTLASAIQIGNPVSIRKAIDTLKDFNGIVEQAGEQQIMDACAAADRAGLFSCPHTGVALAALKKLIGRGLVAPDHRVVVISTAHGLKFPQFKIDYHWGEAGELDNPDANPPEKVENSLEAVRSAIYRRLD